MVMNRISGRSWGALHALLIALLVTAQTGVRIHADKHESGVLRETSCEFCVVASQLGSVCVDNGLAANFQAEGSCLQSESQLSCESVHALSARQRGPPQLF